MKQYYYLFYKFLFQLSDNIHFNILFFVNCFRLKKRFYLLGNKKELTFNNFVNNYKLENFEIKAQLSDKILLSKKLQDEFNISINTPAIIQIFNDESELLRFNFDSLGNYGFVLKANHGSGMNKIINKDQRIAKKNISKILKWFSFPSHLGSREIHYSLIPKKVFIEELIGYNIIDYKLFCFEGRCRVIQLDFDRFNSHTRNFYSTDWELLDFEFVYGRNYAEIERPKQLADLIELSENIAKHFQFVRIDWYIVNDELYLGELTFHPEGGLGPFKNKEQDIDFFSYLKSH